MKAITKNTQFHIGSSNAISFESDPFNTNSNDAGRSLMEELMAANPMPATPRFNDVVEGTVVARAKSGFYVSIGVKSDAFVDDDECEGLKVNDKARFLVISEPDKDDQYQLSQRRAQAWVDLTDTFEQGTTGQAHVTSIVRKGDRVVGANAVICGQRAFIPRRQLNVFGELDSIVKTDVPVKVTKIERIAGSRPEIILSQAKAVRETQETYVSSLQKGDRVTGQVVRILNNEVGVLVDLGPVIGLVHRSELSDNRRARIKDLVSIGQSITCEVLRRDLTKLEVGLTYKKVAQEEALTKLREGAVVKGVVANKATFGVFVTLEGCIDGLLHDSELLKQPGSAQRESFNVGDEVWVSIKSVDADSKRIALSRRGLSNHQQ